MAYISDVTEYERLSAQASLLKLWQVDKDDAKVSFRYFDWLDFLVKGFWPYVVELARLGDDEVIYFYDLEQAENAEFERKFGIYPVIRLNVDMTSREYIAALNEEPAKGAGPAFALSNTSAYLLFPASMKWCVHGEYSIELAELATSVGLPQSPEFPHDFWEASEAERRIRSSQ